MHPHKHRYKIGERGAILGIAVNIGLFLFKFFAGVIGNSSAILADALHTASDLLTSAVVYVGFKIAQKPPDEEHPYGHGRAESIAAKIVSIVLILLGIMVLLKSLRIIADHDFYKPGLIALIAAIVSIGVQYALYLYIRTLGVKIKSASLTADAHHHQSDALSSIAALIGVGLARMGWEFMDPIAGVLVASIVIKMGITNFNTAYNELMDAAPSTSVKKEIEEIILKTPGVKAIKELQVRKLGIDLRIDLTIDVDKDITVEEGHTVTERVKRSISISMPHVRGVLIHVEPYMLKE